MLMGKEKREGKRPGGGDRPRPSPFTATLVTMALVFLAFSAWQWWQLRHPPAFEASLRAAPGMVEAVVDGKRYIAPATARIRELPEEITVRAVPGTAGGEYVLTVAGASAAGVAVPGESDEYVARAADGKVVLVEKNGPPRLGGS
ncbi:MAG: hypothetical protein AB1776_08535 [Bacillota bacterium]